MQRILETLRHGLRLWAALAIMAGLVACGPGTGGTGTGPPIGATFYSAAWNAPPGTLMPCGAHCDRQAELTVDPQRIELDLPCQRFVYEGLWAFDSQGRADVVGRWVSGVAGDGLGGGQPQDVRLTLQRASVDSDDGPLWLTVADLRGQTLLAPVRLEQQANAGDAGACGEPAPSK